MVISLNYFQFKNGPFSWGCLLHGLGQILHLTDLSACPLMCHDGDPTIFLQISVNITVAFRSSSLAGENSNSSLTSPSSFLLLPNLFCLPLKFKNVLRCYFHGTLRTNYEWYSSGCFHLKSWAFIELKNCFLSLSPCNFLLEFLSYVIWISWTVSPGFVSRPSVQTFSPADLFIGNWFSLMDLGVESRMGLLGLAQVQNTDRINPTQHLLSSCPRATSVLHALQG